MLSAKKRGDLRYEMVVCNPQDRPVGQPIRSERETRRSQVDGDAFVAEVLLHLTNGEFSEVSDRGDEDGVGVGIGNGMVEVFERAGAARGDDGDGDGVSDGASHRDVVAGLCAVGVHTGGEDGACAHIGDLFGPFDGVFISGRGAASNHNFEAAGLVGIFSGVDSDSDFFGAEFVDGLFDEFGFFDGGGVDGYF